MNFKNPFEITLFKLFTNNAVEKTSYSNFQTLSILNKTTTERNQTKFSK